MKGVLLAGGLGTRLRPLTHITNKHLLPIYDRPMVLYPLYTLRDSGVTDIMIVCGTEYTHHFKRFLGTGEEYGVKISYAVQNTDDGGIADALYYTKEFVGDDSVAVILGDNIFEDRFKREVKGFDKDPSKAKVFIKEVENPSRFGVVVIKGDRIASIIEKPKNPPSKFVTTGFYIYGPDVFDKIKGLKPSRRNELEITDVHNMYIKERSLSYGVVGGFWSDAGTFDSLHAANAWVVSRRKNGK